MQRPKTIKTQIQEYKNLTKIEPSPKCFKGSISKHLGHLSIMAKTGQMTSTEISKTKKKIIE